jgi:hypothetical protein
VYKEYFFLRQDLWAVCSNYFNQLTETTMRFNFTIVLLILVCAVAHSQTVSRSTVRQTNNTLSQPVKETSFRQLGSGSWYDRARQKIREQEYNIKWKTGLEEYVAVNRKNRIGFYFQQNGYRVISFSSTESNNWEFGFTLKGIQRGAHNFQTSSAARIKQSGNELVYHYPRYAIEYRNDSNGMRQNFIINERLSGKGKLEVVINLEGSLRTAVSDENGLVLSSVQNEELKTVMGYDQLKVWDRDHRVLDAAMELRDAGKTRF